VTAIGSILELPFHERPLLPLLGFDPAGLRESLDLDYTGFGWCRPARLWLQSTGEGAAAAQRPGGAVREVRRPLVLGLHSADDGPALADDVVLEFRLDDGAAVAAPLSRFLARWLPLLDAARGAASPRRAQAEEEPVVLALCNPHRARLRAPAAIGARPLYYALGDVDSWLDPADDPAALWGEEEQAAGGRIRLAAPAWRRAEPASAGG
jgi:hypothetical protein